MADSKKGNRPTKAQQARAQQQQAQSKRGQLRAQQAAAEKARKRNRIVGIVIAAVVLVAILVGLVVWQTHGDSSNPASTSSAGTVEGFIPPNGSGDANYMIVKSDNPASDAIVIDEHTDYQCPGCGAATKSYGALLGELAQRGDIILHIHVRSFLDVNLKNDSSSRAADAATCADTVGKFIEFHDAIFAGQPEKEGEGYTDQQLRVDFASQAGITGDDLTAFQQCYDTRKTAPYVATMEKMNQTTNIVDGATQAPPSGTPAFYANGKEFNILEEVTGATNADGTVAYTPVHATADDLLTYLKSVAG